MKLRAFTLIEMSICLSVTSVLVPIIWVFAQNVEDAQLAARGRVAAALSMRTVSEQLRADLHTHPLDEGDAVRISGRCGGIEYRVEAGTLWRRPATAGPGCEPAALARGVRALRREGRAVVVEMDAPNARFVFGAAHAR